ncbi:Hypothetical_protein [Hexamita inflata]|uniref:Hypothetical_protein n=1 Tax=Hexamita inflata TaxID=28002 RepID=A0AA86VRG6_9EUKA|nr:Hypothetical protein HINF_LOCUS62103 [Hexamita inflata]
MTLRKFSPACLNDMQQQIIIFVLNSNLKCFRLFAKFSFFDASQILDRKGRCRKAQKKQYSSFIRKASVRFSLLPLDRKRRGCELETAANLRPRVSRTARSKVEYSFLAPRIRCLCLKGGRGRQGRQVPTLPDMCRLLSEVH